MFTTELSPAQVMFLYTPSKIGVHEVLGYILRDLTLRRVLNVQKINSFPNDRSRKTQKYFMIIKGENYEGYEAAAFEKSTIIPFTEYNQVQTKTLTNFILKKYSTPSSFINDKIYVPLNKEGYISSIPLLKTFGFYKLSGKGKEVVNDLSEFLTAQEEKLASLIDGDKKEFIEALEETGAYVFYFEHHNPELYKDIISMVKRVNNSKPLGCERDLTQFMEAMNIDLGYFEEH